MKRIIERISSTAMLAVAFMLCATSAWADGESLAETGGYVTSTKALAFADTSLTLDDLGSTYYLRARLAGGNVDYNGAETMAFLLNDATDATKKTYQFQSMDGDYTKSVTVEFTVGEDGIYAQAKGAYYGNPNAFGTKLTNAGTLVDNATAQGYALYDLKLVTPLGASDSINVNFTHGTALSSDSVCIGAGDWIVPYSSWNNLQAVDSVDNTPASATITLQSSEQVTVTLTGTRGSWKHDNLSATRDLQHGYIDETSTQGKQNPTVTVTDIPYAFYKVIVFAATDTENAQFGYVTINGVDYTSNYSSTSSAFSENYSTKTGNSNWGHAGKSNKATGLAEGINYLVSPITSGTTATIVGHRVSDTVRGCIAAIQIVKISNVFSATGGGTLDITDTNNWSGGVVPDGDVEIYVSGNTTINVDAAKTFGTVNIWGSGTLTLSGSSAITASSVIVGGGVTLKTSSANLVAPVELTTATTSVLDINAPCTWAQVISGAGYVQVTGAGETTLSANNTFTGGLLVAAGATVKETGNKGYGGTNGNDGTIYVIGTLDVASSGNNLNTVILQGGKMTNAGSSLNVNHTQYPNISLSVNSEVEVPTGKIWYMISGSWGLTTLSLGNSTLTKSGGGEWTLYGTTLNSNGGTLNISEGSVVLAKKNSTSTAPVLGIASKTFTKSGSGWLTCQNTTIKGTVNVTGGRLTANSNSSFDSATINVSSGASIDISNIRTGVTLNFESGSTLILDELASDDGEISFTVSEGSSAPSVTVYNGNDSKSGTAVVDGTTMTVSYTPSTSGNVCWYDYEFNGNLNSSGSAGTQEMGSDANTASDYYDGSMRYTASTAWRGDIGFSTASSWSAAIRCTVPKHRNTVVVGFGSGTSQAIVLAAGAPDESGEYNKMNLLYYTNSGENAGYTLIREITVANAATTQHLYVFSVADSKISVYCDGTKLVDEASLPGGIVDGVQLGSILNQIPGAWYPVDYGRLLHANTLTGDAKTDARIDFLRIYNTAIGSNLLSQLWEENPSIKVYTRTISGDVDWSTTDAWTLNDASADWANAATAQAVVTVSEDTALTLPSTLSADSIRFDIASGKTLTLVAAEGGSTVTAPEGLIANGGTFALSGTFALPVVSGTAAVKVADDATVTLAGNLSVVNADGLAIGDGATLYPKTYTIPTVTGGETAEVVYENRVPQSDAGWTATSTWAGTVTVKTTGADYYEVNNFNLNDYGHSGSTVKFSGIKGYLKTGTPSELNVQFKVENNGSLAGFYYSNGNGNDRIKIAKLKGSGTLSTGNAGNGGIVWIGDVSDFGGNLTLSTKQLVIGGEAPASNDSSEKNGKLLLQTNASVAPGMTWTANGGFTVDQGVTLSIPATGALACGDTKTNKMKGRGTVVYTGKMPDMDTAWSNSDWLGVLEIHDVSRGALWKLGDFGNTSSKILLDNVRSYLNTAANSHNVGTLEIASGGWIVDGGYSSGTYTIPATLLGSGKMTFEIANSAYGTAIKIVNFTGDASGFKGAIAFGSSANVTVVFGDIPETKVNQQIVVSSGKIVHIESGTVAWEASGGVIVDGTVNIKDINWPSKPFSIVSGGGTINIQNSIIQWFDMNSTFTGTLNLVKDDSGHAALCIKDGGRDIVNTFAYLTGDGTFKTEGKARQTYKFGDATEFTGSFDIALADDTPNGYPRSGRRVVIGTSSPDQSYGSTITIDSGATAKLGADATWATGNGIYVNGTLVVEDGGTLASATTFGNNSTIRYDSLAALTASSTITVDSANTVNVTFEAGVSLTAPTYTLISWSSSPAGNFSLPSAVTDVYKVEKAVDGLKLVRYVAIVNGVKYISFADAMDAAGVSGTICLVENYAQDITLLPGYTFNQGSYSYGGVITVDCRDVSFGASEVRRAILTTDFALTLGSEGNVVVLTPETGAWVTYVNGTYVLYLAKPGTIFSVY